MRTTFLEERLRDSNKTSDQKTSAAHENKPRTTAQNGGAVRMAPQGMLLGLADGSSNMN